MAEKPEGGNIEPDVPLRPATPIDPEIPKGGGEAVKEGDPEKVPLGYGKS